MLNIIVLLDVVQVAHTVHQPPWKYYIVISETSEIILSVHNVHNKTRYSKEDWDSTNMEYISRSLMHSFYY